MPLMPRRIDLDEIEQVAAGKVQTKVKKRTSRAARPPQKHGRTLKSRNAVRPMKRTPRPVGMGVEELKVLDPQDKRLRDPRGRPRIRDYDDPNFDPTTLDWKERLRWDRQHRHNRIRGEIRKYDAIVVAAQREHLGVEADRPVGKAEDTLIAARILDLDDWDDEELARGYRKNRDGRWGRAPRFIPREVQQESFRRLVKRHSTELKSSFIEATKELVRLSKHANSEKVRLDAAREVMDRLLGKVPETVQVTQSESPWQQFLVDALEPYPEVRIPRSAIEVGGPVEAPAPQSRRAESPSRKVAPGPPARLHVVGPEGEEDIEAKEE